MKQANAKQRQWESDVAEWAQDNLHFLYGDEYNDSHHRIELHHVVGRSAKRNKVAIGHEFILPVPFMLHNVMSNHKDNVTNFKKNFVKRFGTQRNLFATMIGSMAEQGYIVPDDIILDAIGATSA
jgi:hypothetical protein